MKEILLKIGDHIKKTMGNYWLFGISLIMLGGSILFQVKDVGDNNYGIILGFIGILATFIVVGNYAQVMAIRSDFENKIKENEKSYNEKHYKAIRKINILMSTIKSQQREFEININNIEIKTTGAILHLQANNYYTNRKYLLAFLDYTESANYYNTINEYINLKQVLTQINKVMRILSIEEIEKGLANNNRNIYKLIKAINDESLGSIISEINETINSLPKTITERLEMEKKRTI